jgi:2-phosphosulfolactate phosphatase
MYFDQSEYEIRCEWGLEGVTHLAPNAGTVVVVDVLSFTTCVDIATARGAIVYPFRAGEGTAEEFARSLGAVAASTHRTSQGFSLSPSSLLGIDARVRLVLPSPNGSTLTLASSDTPTFAGCLRNASAVAAAVQPFADKVKGGVLVVPAGERWSSGTLRPSAEDLIGAGAIIHSLRGSKSPEARIAEAAFLRACADLAEFLRQCSSGQELIERGFAEDVELAAQFNVSKSAPQMVDGAYRVPRL